jgi:uncharacterized membrane protein
VLAVALALASSPAYGVSDFLGGLTSRSVALLPVLLVSQGTALILLSIIVISRGEGPPGGAFLLYAAIAGLSETVGVAALYRGLAVGVMSIVAPVGAAAPAFPVVVGMALGEFPTPTQGAGIVLAVSGASSGGFAEIGPHEAKPQQVSAMERAQAVAGIRTLGRLSSEAVTGGQKMEDHL